jgi:hypothetical protein
MAKQKNKPLRDELGHTRDDYKSPWGRCLACGLAMYKSMGYEDKDGNMIMTAYYCRNDKCKKCDVQCDEKCRKIGC